MSSLFILILSILSVANARMGNEGGGGGSEIISHFHARADIALKVLKMKGVTEIDVDALEETLEEAEIEVVDELTDRFDIPVSDGYDAWAWTGHIRLKTANFKKFMEEKSTIDHIVVHELMRASGKTNLDGRSYFDLDDHYALTIHKWNLNVGAENSIPYEPEELQAQINQARISAAKVNKNLVRDFYKDRRKHLQKKNFAPYKKIVESCYTLAKSDFEKMYALINEDPVNLPNYRESVSRLGFDTQLCKKKIEAVEPERRDPKIVKEIIDGITLLQKVIVKRFVF